MGSPDNETGRRENEGPQTRVTLTKDFWLGVTDVTQAQWKAVMGGNPSAHKGPDLPVEMVSWDNAMAFCQKLNGRFASHLPTGWTFTLPTEAQWEYACRAGTTGPYAGDLDAMAWYRANSDYAPHAVGTRQPNVWGLYDMHGNAWEWCRDWYGDYPGGESTNPTGQPAGAFHVLRGGSCASEAAYCRSSFRFYLPPDFHNAGVSFRVALCPVP
jgi:formylglycine-generating enzyme required for sulfatase activity